MTVKVRSANRRRQLLELPSDISDQLDTLVPGFGAALNDRLKRAAEHLEATAGLRGQVNIADVMAMENNPITELKDPVAPQDGVNLRTLDDRLQCKNLVRILEQCADFSEALDNENDGIPPPSPAPTFFVGRTIWSPDAISGTAAIVAVSNNLEVELFFLPFAFEVKTINFKRATGAAGDFVGIGLYDVTGQKLLVNTGPVDMSSGTLKTVTLTPTVTVPAGMYWLGQTGGRVGQSPPSVSILALQSGQIEAFNSVTRSGKITGVGSAGALPSSFDPTTLTALAHDVPYVLFGSPAA